MSVEIVSVVFVTCDEPGCEAEETFDPPKPNALKGARAKGWAITEGGKGGDKARCPAHRRYVRRRPQ